MREPLAPILQLGDGRQLGGAAVDGTQFATGDTWQIDDRGALWKVDLDSSSDDATQPIGRTLRGVRLVFTEGHVRQPFSYRTGDWLPLRAAIGPEQSDGA